MDKKRQLTSPGFAFFRLQSVHRWGGGDIARTDLDFISR